MDEPSETGHGASPQSHEAAATGSGTRKPPPVRRPVAHSEAPRTGATRTHTATTAAPPVEVTVEEPTGTDVRAVGTASHALEHSTASVVDASIDVGPDASVDLGLDAERLVRPVPVAASAETVSEVAGGWAASTRRFLVRSGASISAGWVTARRAAEQLRVATGEAWAASRAQFIRDRAVAADRRAERRDAARAIVEVDTVREIPHPFDPIDPRPDEPSPFEEAAVVRVVEREVAPRPASEIEPSAVRPAEIVTAPSPRARKPPAGVVLTVRGLTKRYDDTVAVNNLDLEVKAGSFYGIVGPNGAGKTTSLSMITGLVRPDAGSVFVRGADVWADPARAKRELGVLPDRLRLFDRLTGAQLLYYSGILRGLSPAMVRGRTADLAGAFGLERELGRLVSDYSAGMTKKIALAAAMIHSPRLLVLDEPFESVDPVSAATVTAILKNYTAAGGTVLLSSHSMEMVERTCDYVAVIARGELLANGTIAAVRRGRSLQDRFVQLVGRAHPTERLEWLQSFSD